VLATRASDEHVAPSSRPYRRRCIIRWRGWSFCAGTPREFGAVAVVCAGTSDLPVAEEAAVTAEALGARVSRVHDVGVAGLQQAP